MDSSGRKEKGGRVSSRQVGSESGLSDTRYSRHSSQRCGTSGSSRTESASLWKKSHKMLVIGREGAGKKATANTILGKKEFTMPSRRQEQPSLLSGKCETSHGIMEVMVVCADAPSPADLPILRRGLDRQPHAILFVVQIGTYDTEDHAIFRWLRKGGGADVLRHVVVVFTGGDRLRPRDDIMKGIPERLRHVIHKCEDRYIIFNNKDKNNLYQVEDLLELIGEMMEQNGGPFPGLQQAKGKCAHADSSDSVWQSGRRQHKTSMTEAKHRNNASGYEKRGTKAKSQASYSEDETEDRNEESEETETEDYQSDEAEGTLNTDEDEWYKEKGNEQKGARPPDAPRTENAKKSTHRKGQENYQSDESEETTDTDKDEDEEQTLKSMLACKPPERRDNTKAKASKHKHAYKKEAYTSRKKKSNGNVDTEDDEEQEEDIGRKRHPGSLLKEKTTRKSGSESHGNSYQENKVLIPENSSGSKKELKGSKPKSLQSSQFPRAKRQRIQSSDFHHRTDDLEHLRFLLLGKTGSGKSTTGNTILGGKLFHSGGSFTSVTSECALKEAVVNGTRIEIVDSPGLCDTSKSDADIGLIIAKTVVGLHPGPHALLYVLKADRFTDEEYEVFKKLETLFDKRLYDYLIVVFTGGDNFEFDGTTVDAAISTAPPTLRKLINDCNNRYIVFNNRTQNTWPQVDSLLKMARDMVKKNGLNPYYRCTKYDGLGNRLEEEVRRRIAGVETEMLQKQEAFQNQISQKEKEMNAELYKQKEEFEKKIAANEMSKGEAEQKLKEMTDKQNAELADLNQKLKDMDEKHKKELAALPEQTEQAVKRETVEGKGFFATIKKGAKQAFGGVVDVMAAPFETVAGWFS